MHRAHESIKYSCGDKKRENINQKLQKHEIRISVITNIKSKLL